MKTFTTEVEQNEEFPFVSQKFRNQNVNYQLRVRVHQPFSLNLKLCYQRIHQLIQMQESSPYLVVMKKVTHNAKENSFFVTYQHPSYKLRDFYSLKLKICQAEHQLVQIGKYLLERSIKPVIEEKLLFLDDNHKIKYLLLPSFVQLSSHTKIFHQIQELHQSVSSLLKTLRVHQEGPLNDTSQDDKFISKGSERDLSAYTKKFEEKIASIENRILLNKFSAKKLTSNQKLKRRKKFSYNLTEESQSVSSSSSNSIHNPQNKVKSYIEKLRTSYEGKKTSIEQNPFAKTENNANFYQKRKDGSRLEQEFRSHQGSSNQKSQEDPEKRNLMKSSKLTNSLIIQERNQELERLKQHKSSFGDYSTNNHFKVQNTPLNNEKEAKLKRRISFALQKSQYALSLYEKYRKKKAPQF